ncbi:P-loop containing nucleoside triphosphate hydrolase protein [Xylaria sp. FL0933]|nr:P-loop containing nucleoside triphosphate hydrolase protein [Xylaria sp. FL0933]
MDQLAQPMDARQEPLPVASHRTEFLNVFNNNPVVVVTRYVTVGQKVGYNVRFDKNYTDSTLLIYMTDGMLATQMKNSPNFSQYKCIIIDEVHERTVNTDVLMAKLREIVVKRVRTDLKVVLISATLDAAGCQRYPDNAPLVQLRGRTYPVEILYLQKNVANVEGTNDGERGLNLLPLHGSFPKEQQNQVFARAKAGTRKCIVFTNIAETSLTIGGIVYVIDSGLVRLAQWHARIRMNALRVVPISKASANQRAGRAGRTRPSICFRMYGKDFEDLANTNTPSIQSTNFAPTLLGLMASNTWEHLSHVNLISLPHKYFITQAFRDPKG